jgi:acetyl esterase/lipase
MVLRLWSDEIEAMRAEGRAAVEAGRSSMMLEIQAGDLSPAEQLAAQRESMAAVTFPQPDTEERVLGGVPCRILRPEQPARAVYLHFHGGGMVAGSAGLMDIPNRMVAEEHGVAVVSVEYRKAPEFPFPAGPDDGLAVARWLVEHAGAELGSDRLLIGGESAGAYLTAAVALRVRDELGAIDRVDGLNLTFGIYDWGRSPSQRGRRAHDGFDVLSPEAAISVGEWYLPGRTDDERRAPEISPAFADLRGLPPCFVSVGTCDHLLDDSLLFAARAAAAEVDVELFVLPDMPHGFQMFDCGIIRAWASAQSEWMGKHVG